MSSSRLAREGIGTQLLERVEKALRLTAVAPRRQTRRRPTTRDPHFYEGAGTLRRRGSGLLRSGTTTW